MRERVKRIALIGLSGLLLSACTGPLVQTHISEKSDKRVAGVGLTYMLPIQPVQLKISRTFEEASKKPKTDYDATKKANQDAKTASKEADEAESEAQTAFDGAPDNDDLKVELARAKAKAAIAKKSYQSASSKLHDATETLIKALEVEELRLSLTNLIPVAHKACPDVLYNGSCPAPSSLGDSSCQAVLQEITKTCQMITSLGGDPKKDPVVAVEKLEISLLPMVGDPAKTFTASFVNKKSRDDKFKIEVNEAGLLQSANLTTADKSGAIVTGLVKTVLLAAANPYTDYSEELTRVRDRFVLEKQKGNDIEDEVVDEVIDILINRELPTCDSPLDVPPFSGTAQKQVAIDEMVLIFDPVSSESLTTLNKRLCEAKFNARLSASVHSGGQAVSGNELTLPQNEVSNSEVHHFDGLVYRRVRPVDITIHRPVGTTAKRVPVTSFLANLPNGAPADGVAVHSAALVSMRNDLTFVDGMLVSSDYDKPSQVAAGVDIAVGVLELPFEIIGKLLTLNINQMDASSKQFDLQTKELELANKIAAAEESDADQQINETQGTIDLAKKQQELALLELQKEKNILETQRQIEELKKQIKELQSDN